MGIAPDSGKTYTSIPTIIDGLSGVSRMFVGPQQRAALLTNGKVKAWGVGGLLCVELDISSKSVPTDADDINNNPCGPATMIAYGSDHAALIGPLYNGTNLYTWGQNADQRCGYVPEGPISNYASPMEDPKIQNVKDIQIGVTSTIITMNDGTLKVFGLNPNGQLGNGTNTQVFAPTTLEGISAVKQVSMSGTSTIVLLEDGTLRAFGQNTEGQLGDGTTTNRLSPVEIKIYKD